MGEIIPALVTSPGRAGLSWCERPVDYDAHRGDAGDRPVVDDHHDVEHVHLDDVDVDHHDAARNDHDVNLDDHDNVARSDSRETQTSVAQAGQRRDRYSRAVDCGGVAEPTPAANRQSHQDDDDVGRAASPSPDVLATRTLLERYCERGQDVPL